MDALYEASDKELNDADVDGVLKSVHAKLAALEGTAPEDIADPFDGASIRGGSHLRIDAGTFARLPLSVHVAVRVGDADVIDTSTGGKGIGKTKKGSAADVKDDQPCVALFWTRAAKGKGKAVEQMIAKGKGKSMDMKGGKGKGKPPRAFDALSLRFPRLALVRPFLGHMYVNVCEYVNNGEGDRLEKVFVLMALHRQGVLQLMQCGGFGVE